jgi:ABC-2 type transport system permease protein
VVVSDQEVRSLGVIETEDLTRRFGAVNAVQDLTISVSAGEVFGLLGPNDAGKTKVMAIASMEALKLRHDPLELLTRAVQPALWLLVFGQVLARTRAIPTGTLSYVDFIAPGFLAQSVLFIAIFYGISAIWERDLEILHKFLVSPTPRPALVLGKALAAGVRGLAQAVIVYVLALILGVGVDLAVLLAVTAGLVALAGRLYPTLAE